MRSTRRIITRNPFLCIGACALLLFVLAVPLRLHAHDVIGPLVTHAYFWLGRPIWWVANAIHNAAPDLNRWADRLLVVTLGLLPYAAADWLYRRLVPAPNRSFGQPQAPAAQQE